MEGDDVAIGIDLIIGLHALHMAVQVPCCLNRDVRVTAVNIHTQLSCPVGQRTADGAQADNAQLLAPDLMTGELGLALFHHSADFGAALDGLDPVNTTDDVTAGQEHAAQGQFHNTAGIGTGSIEDHDALFGTGGQGNVVDTGTGSGNGQQIRRHLHLVHIGAANQNSIRLFQIVNGFIILRQQGCTLGRDFIQIMDMKHTEFLFSAILFLEFFHELN